MGTRNLIEVKSDNQIKIAQYGQWDGYPTGQGKTIASFLKTVDLDKFKEKLAKVKFISHQEVDKKTDNTQNWATLYPELSRDTGALILQLVYEGKAIELWDSQEFKKDTLFCEYAYLIDLDNKAVEISGRINKILTFEEFTKEGKMKELEKEISDNEKKKYFTFSPFDESVKYFDTELEAIDFARSNLV